jgi:tetratricopeptide (TPR) repeat protein
MEETSRLFKEALDLLDEGRFAEVEEKLEPLLSTLSPTGRFHELDVTSIKLCLGQAKDGLGKLDQAETLFKELNEFQKSRGWPDMARAIVLHELFMVLRKRGKSKEADSILEEVMEMPDSREMLKRKANFLDIVGRKDEALEYLRKGLKFDKYDSMAMALMMNILETKGDVTTVFVCGNCKTRYDIPVYQEDPTAAFKRAAFVREKKRLLDSLQIVTCKNCGTENTLSLWLCRNCFDDYAGESVFETKEGRKGKRASVLVPRPCPFCSDENEINVDNSQEIRFLKEMVKHLELEGDIKVFEQSVYKDEKHGSLFEADAWLRKAQRFAAEGKFDEASDAFGKAMELAPDRTDIFEAYMNFIKGK